MNTTTRNDVKQLAATIEVLAKQMQDQLDGNSDFLGTANEIVRNNSILIFNLGELCALEQVGATGKTVRARPVNANYHNLRDNRGRFIKKI
jgi:hypothetical protein